MTSQTTMGVFLETKPASEMTETTWTAPARSWNSADPPGQRSVMATPLAPGTGTRAEGSMLEMEPALAEGVVPTLVVRMSFRKSGSLGSRGSQDGHEDHGDGEGGDDGDQAGLEGFPRLGGGGEREGGFAGFRDDEGEDKTHDHAEDAQDSDDAEAGNDEEFDGEQHDADEDEKDIPPLGHSR